MKLVLISGSLRKASHNTKTLNALEPLFDATVTCTRVSIDLPLYNEDLENTDDLPASVTTLRDAISEADGVIICSPEYNYAIPGTVKNALDWVSRPPGENRWMNKPVGILGASPSFTGTARGQTMVKTCFLLVGARVFSGEQVLIAEAHQRFDDDGKLTHEPTRTVMKQFADKFVQFVASSKA